MRAVAYLRVSSVGQVENESLPAQEQAAKNYCKNKGFRFLKVYADKGISGTSEKNRTALQEMKQDAKSGQFDIVLIRTISRFGRNMLDSLNNEKFLRDHEIRLVSMDIDIDFSTPIGKKILADFSWMAEEENRQRVSASMASKLKLARENIPRFGNLPFGRKYENGQWGIVPEKQAKIQKAAKMFISGEKMNVISKRVGIAKPQLYKVLSKVSGDKWEVNFKSKLAGIDEKITFKIPPLLSKAMIKAVHKRAKTNATLHHGQRKNQYLLGRMIFCGHCGYAMSGGTFDQKYRYYLHMKESGNKRIDCGHFNNIKAHLIEGPVMEDIFDLFGDRKRIEQTMRTASTDLDLAKKLEGQIVDWEKEVRKINRDEEKLVNLVLDNVLTNEVIKKKMDEFAVRKESISGDIQIARNKLEMIATEEELTSRSDQIKRRIERSFLTSDHRLKEMGFSEKRELLQMLFNGEDSEGKRYGVYLEKRKSHWIYKIKGNFQEIVGSFKLDLKADIGSQDQEAVK
jgi:site-specific DNA recombinase